MNIKNRITRLETKQCDTLQPGFWNLARVSTKDLIELRNLIIRDPVKAELLKQRLIDEGILEYEYQTSTRKT